MHFSSLSAPGAAVLPVYFLLTIAIGWIARRHKTSASDYLNATRSLPLWIVAASFLAANCGALEIVGLSAMAAEYGVQAFQFYWIGAIPGMIFVALWMIPVYCKSGVRSVPEYLEVRYGSGMRLLNACISALMMLMLAGISLYAMAQVLHAVLGWSFWEGTCISAATVYVYVLLGGVRATIYNEVFQLLVMMAGLLPLFLRAVRLLHGPAWQSGPQRHVWVSLPLASTAAPMDVMGVVAGLGFVLSFSYWGTDFVLIQRALTARDVEQARQVPLWAGFGKLGFSLLVVLPGIAAHELFRHPGSLPRFDQALPAMMAHLYGPTMLGVGLTALAASLMSGLAANVSAFAALWTEDIYRTHLRSGRPEQHYLRVGRMAITAATVVGIAASSVSLYFGNLMEHVQLIFSLFNAPFWAVFLLGMADRRTTSAGALAGFLSGVGVGVVHEVAVMRHWIVYGSVMTADFHAAIYTFVTALTVTLIKRGDCCSAASERRPALVFRWREAVEGRNPRRLLVLAAVLLVTCAVLNVVWR